jgi:diguanylate cyclase (GGDEF)-like protein
MMEDATVLCQRFKEIVESRVFHFKDTDINITISLGVAGMPNNRASSHSELIRYADEALYTAKDNGRNRVEICNKK